MTKQLVAVAVLAASLCAACPASAAEAPAQSRVRPPAVPLVACDPYFSVWSPFDRLNEGETRHWTGKPHRLTSLVRIDGVDAPTLATAGVIYLAVALIATYVPARRAFSLDTVRALGSI